MSSFDPATARATSRTVTSSLRIRRLRRFVEQARRRRGDLVELLDGVSLASHQPLFVLDHTNDIAWWSEPFAQMWGLPLQAPADGESAIDQFVASLRQQASPADATWLESEISGLSRTTPRGERMITFRDGRTAVRRVVALGGRSGFRGLIWSFREVTETIRSERLQAALFRIADVSHSSTSLDEMFERIHEIVAQLMDATNFYVALVDEEAGGLRFPYFVDQFDSVPPAVRPERGLTSYVLRTGQPLLATPDVFHGLLSRREVEDVGTPSVDWLGVPLKRGATTFGVIGVQSYSNRVRFSELDRDVLVFVSHHLSSAIEQKRKEAEIRASEIRYRQMFEHNRAIKLLIDQATGQIVDANHAACKFYGYSREEIRNITIFQINQLTEDEIRQEMRSALEQDRVYFRFRHRLKNGEVRDVDVHSGPIEIHGRQLLFSIITDVTEKRRAEHALEESERKYRNIFDFAPVGIYQSRRNGDVLTANSTLAAILGYDDPAELIGLNLERDVYWDCGEREKLIAMHHQHGRARDLEIRWRTKSGECIWVRVDAHVIDNDEPGSACYEGFVYDITERKRAEERMLRQSAAMEASIDGVALVDPAGRFSYTNRSFRNLFGYGEHDDLGGMPWRRLIGSKEFGRFAEEVAPSIRSSRQWRGEAQARKRNGSIVPVEVSITTLADDTSVVVVRDVTERAYAEEQIRHLAYHDPLTGLPNRLLFKDRLTVALSQAQREKGRRVAVLFLDLDRFKVINDSLGHNVGDYLLQAAANRIQSCVRESDTVARLGGDEFTLLLPQIQTPDDATRVAKKLLEAFRFPFMINGRELFLTTSIGISIFPDDGKYAETLIKNADNAMYQAKEQGRDNVQIFNEIINARALERLVLENGLRRAVVQDEFIVHYQPIVDLKSGRIHGVEALVRWNHPELGMLSPARFIPVAETTGLMAPIGLRVMQAACAQLRAWHERGYRDLSVAVNLAVAQLQHADLIDNVRQTLEENGLPPSALEIEITESSAMQDPDRSIDTLQQLHDLGVRISLDDFGIGHSSLSYLKRLPIDTLKIDQSFVRDVCSDRDTAAIFSAIVAMGHKLRLRIVAEGVETETQRRFLELSQCDQMQGFLFSRPRSAEEIEALFRRHAGETGQWDSNGVAG